MSNRRLLACSAAALALASAQGARADVTVLDQNNWKLMVGGFAEFDSILDTTRSLSEIPGNNPISIAGTAAGDNGRFQMSMRNSRLSLTVLSPSEADWKIKGYIETDFMGYDPAPSSQSEASFYTNPTLRLRHAFLSAENNGWQLLIGQYWTLFGWQPTYFLATVDIAPVSGMMYQRTPQVALTKTMDLNDSNSLQAGLSFDRPSQRDSMLPNVSGGVRWIMNSRKSALAGGTSGVKNQPMSLGISGTLHELETPTVGGLVTDTTHYLGSAIAGDILLPILAASDDKDPSNTLTLTGEVTTGQGYGDEFPGWTGNQYSPLNSATAGSNPVTNLNTLTNLDAGIGGYDSTGAFQLVHLTTFNLQLQYHLPGDSHTFATAGYGQLYSNNISALTGSASKTLYERTESVFINMMHDCSQQVRVGLEVAQFTTHYITGDVPHDDRVQFSTWYRF